MLLFWEEFFIEKFFLIDLIVYNQTDILFTQIKLAANRIQAKGCFI